MVHDLLGHEHDELSSGSGSHHVEAIQAEQEFVLVCNRIRVSKRKRRQHDVSLLSLESLDGVDGLADPLNPLCLKDALQPRHDESLLRSVRRHNSDPAIPELLQGVRLSIERHWIAGPVAFVLKLVSHSIVHEPREGGDSIRLELVPLTASTFPIDETDRLLVSVE